MSARSAQKVSREAARVQAELYETAGTVVGRDALADYRGGARARQSIGAQR